MAHWQQVVDAARYEAGESETLYWLGLPTDDEMVQFVFDRLDKSQEDQARAYKRGRLANHFAYAYAAFFYIPENSTACP